MNVVMLKFIWNMELDLKPENIRRTDMLWGIFPPDQMQKVVYPIGPWILQIMLPQDTNYVDFDEHCISFSASATLYDVLWNVQQKYGKDFTFIGFHNKTKECDLPIFVAHLAVGLL